MNEKLEGKRIILISINDPYTNLKHGDMGTIAFVDDENQIHVNWDNGSKLAVCRKYGDQFTIERKNNV